MFIFSKNVRFSQICSCFQILFRRAFKATTFFLGSCKQLRVQGRPGPDFAHLPGAAFALREGRLRGVLPRRLVDAERVGEDRVHGRHVSGGEGHAVPDQRRPRTGRAAAVTGKE